MTPTSTATIQVGSVAYQLLFVPLRTGIFLALIAFAFGLQFDADGIAPAALVFLLFVPWDELAEFAPVCRDKRLHPGDDTLQAERAYEEAQRTESVDQLEQHYRPFGGAYVGPVRENEMPGLVALVLGQRLEQRLRLRLQHGGATGVHGSGRGPAARA